MVILQESPNLAGGGEVLNLNVGEFGEQDAGAIVVFVIAIENRDRFWRF